MRLLLASDSPYYPTGFALQLGKVAEYLSDQGHDVHYLGWQTRGKFVVEGSKYTIHDGGNQPFGVAGYQRVFAETQPDALITLGDAHMVQALTRMPRPFWFGYYPLDGHPVSPAIKSVLEQMDVRVAMSRYGQGLTQSTGLNAEYSPHGVDTNVFKQRDKEDAKERLGLDPNDFIFGSVARLNPRKHHDALLIAFAQVVKKRDDVKLYLHCDPFDPLMFPDQNHNYQFIKLIDRLGIKDKIIFTQNMDFLTGIPQEELAWLYNAFDVHILPTGGEGFGVPTIEAMASGVPSIMTDYTTSRELIGLDETGKTTKKKRGILVPYSQLYMEHAGVYKAWIDMKQFQKAMIKYYNDREAVVRHGKNGRAYAVRNYDWDVTLPVWDRLVAGINYRVEVHKK